MKQHLKSIQQGEIFSLLAIFFLILVGSMQAGESIAPPSEESPPIIHIDDREEERRWLTAQSQLVTERLKNIQDRERLIADRERENAEKEDSIAQREDSITQKEEEIKAKKINYPPILTISSRELSFELGEAFPEDGPDALRNHVETSVVPKIQAQLSEYEHIDVVEVIGHADATDIPTVEENLDKELLETLAKMKTENYSQIVQRFKSLDAASNVDLGLLRALVIVETLKAIEKEQPDVFDRRVTGFLAYSAGQLYLPGETSVANPEATAADEDRRRIEIRLTQRNMGESAAPDKLLL